MGQRRSTGRAEAAARAQTTIAGTTGERGFFPPTPTRTAGNPTAATAGRAASAAAASNP